MEQLDNGSNGNILDLDRFPHHAYEPTVRHANGHANGQVYAISNRIVH